MLVLCRKKGEVINVTTPSGEEIEIMVTWIERGKVGIGVTADKRTVIDRAEVRLAKEADRLNKGVGRG